MKRTSNVDWHVLQPTHQLVRSKSNPRHPPPSLIRTHVRIFIDTYDHGIRGAHSALRAAALGVGGGAGKLLMGPGSMAQAKFGPKRDLETIGCYLLCTCITDVSTYGYAVVAARTC